MEKLSVFIEIRVLFWPEISALGVFFNFDNERMRPPKNPSAPTGGFMLLGKCVKKSLAPKYFLILNGTAETVTELSSYMPLHGLSWTLD